MEKLQQWLQQFAANVKSYPFMQNQWCQVVALSLAGSVIAMLGTSAVNLLLGGHLSLVYMLMSSLLTSIVWVGWQLYRQQGSSDDMATALAEAEKYLDKTSLQLSVTHKQVDEYTAILNGQIDGISKITEEASVDLIGALYEIETALNESIDKIEVSQRNSASIRSSGSSEIEQVNDRLEEITQLINVQREQDAAHHTAIQEVLQEIDNLKELTELVKNIAFQTNLLALNAAIEAARAGDYGRGFAVVAEQVRTLSSQSSEAANRIENGIKSALNSAKQHGEKLLATNSSHETCDLLSSFSQSLTNVTDQYQKLESFQPKMLSGLSVVASDIAGMVSSAIGKIQFQDIIRQRAENVKLEHDALVALFGHFSTYINERKDFDETFNLSTAEMFEKYVMEDQRRIHFDLTATSGEKRPAEETREPKIQLF